jgi:hypothetical protein
MRWPWLVCFGTVLLFPTSASAAKPDRPFRVTYHAAPGCPAEAAIRADVAAHVHDDSRAAGARVDLGIEGAKGGYVGTLVAFDEHGEQGSRRIEGRTCSEVAQALAFLAGLAIELGGRIEPEPSPPPPPPPQPLSVAPPRTAPAKPSPAIEVSTMLLEGARGGFGPGPRTSGELGVEVGAARGILAPSARLVGFVGESHLESVSSPPEGADFWFVGGRLELCPLRFGNTDFAVRPCAGGEVGPVYGQGRIALHPRSVSELWSSAELTLRVQWFATKSFFAEAGGGPVFPIVRTRYYFEPAQTLFTVPMLTARGAIGFGVRF